MRTLMYVECMVPTKAELFNELRNIYGSLSDEVFEECFGVAWEKTSRWGREAVDYEMRELASLCRLAAREREKEFELMRLLDPKIDQAAEEMAERHGEELDQMRNTYEMIQWLEKRAREAGDLIHPVILVRPGRCIVRMVLHGKADEDYMGETIAEAILAAKEAMSDGCS